MKKFTLFLSLFFVTAMTALAQDYSLSENRLNAEGLNGKTSATLIAIKNLSATNHYYFVGNTGAVPFSTADFSDAAVFVWQPVQEGVAGSYYLKKTDGTYMQTSSPKDFGSVENAAVFTATNPTQAGSGPSSFNGDVDSKDYVDDETLLVRFVNASGSWINVQNGDAGTPLYNSGTGGWTVHYVYEVTSAPEAEPLALVSIDPAADSKLNSVSQFVLTFNQPVSVVEDKAAILMFNSMMVCGLYPEVSEDGTVVTLHTDMPYSYEGEYMVYLEEGLFTTADGQVNEESIYAYSVVAPEPIKALSELTNNKAYTVTQLNHTQGVTAWAVAPGAEALKSNADLEVELSATNNMFHFAFVTPDEGTTYYLYHAAEKKFVNKDGSLGAEPVDAVNFSNGAFEGTFVVNFDESHYINVGGSRQMTIDDWSTADGGNSCTFTPVADFDPTEALAPFAPAEPLTLMSIEPAADSKLNSVSQFVLTFNQPVSVVEDKAAILMFNSMMVCGLYPEVSEDRTVVTLHTDMPYSYEGEYMVYLEEGLFTTADGQVNEESIYAYTVVAPEPIKALSELTNNKAYTVTQLNHSKGVTAWAIAPGAEALKSNVDLEVELSATNNMFHFAFVTPDEGTTHYLYHVAEKKFVNKDGSLGATPADAVNFSNGAYEGTFVVNFDESHYINVGGSRQMIIDTWSIADGGNSCTFTPVADFDPAEALRAFASATTVTEVSPACGHYETGIPAEITVTFSADIQSLDFGMLRSDFTGFRGYMLAEEDYKIEGNKLTLTLPAEYITNASQASLSLQVMDVSGNPVTYAANEDELMEEYVVLNYTAPVKSDLFAMVAADPEAGEVESLSEINVTFSYGGAGFVGGFDNSKVVEVLNAEGTQVATATMSIVEEEFTEGEETWSFPTGTVKFVLSNAITEVGEYTFVIPAGTVYNEGYYPEDADFGVQNGGAIYNPEIRLVYIVTGGTSANAEVYFYHPTYNGLLKMAADGSSLSLDQNVAEEKLANYPWQLIPAEGENEYYIYNPSTQLYAGTCVTSQNVTGVSEEGKKVYVWEKDGQFDVFLDKELGGQYNYMHIAGHNVLVGWEAVSAASHWFVLNNADEYANVLENKSLEADLAAALAKAEKAKEISQPYYKPLITDAAQFSSNAKEATEGSYEALLDGSQNTFFHSEWSATTTTEAHNLQVVLDNNELTAFLVKYQARNAGGAFNDRPTIMSIYGGTLNDDGTVTYEAEAFANLTTEDGIGEVVGEFKFTTEKVYDAFKFEVHETIMSTGNKGNKWFTYGEFQMYSQEMTPGELEMTEDEVAALDAAVEAAKNAHLVKDNYEVLIEALEEALIDAYNYDREVIALIAHAEDLLAKVGVGYPAADSEARATFMAAIEEVAAAPFAETKATLAAAIEAYCGTTEVALPENNKFYSFTMVAKNGNKFYLNYTGEDVAMVAATGEDLPDSAKFRASLNDDGTYEFKTIDGKYLVYHSKYAGVDWLENRGNTTGLQAESDKMTIITLGKMVNGNNVAAANNEQIFGLLTWYSLRGYDTGKNQDTYGYMVLKADGSDYDGASAPFWNDNYSSAFLVEEATAPAMPATTVTEVSPECGHYAEGVPAEITVTFSANIDNIGYGVLRTDFTMGRGEMLTEEMYTIEGNKVTFKFAPELVNGSANLALVFEAIDANGNAVTYSYDEEYLSEGYVNLMYTADKKANLFAMESVDPAAGDVEKLDVINVTFANISTWGFAYVGGFDESKAVVVLDEAGNVVATATKEVVRVEGQEWYSLTAKFTLDKPVTAAGKYTFVVPEGTVYNDGYYPEEEDLGVSWGAIYNPEIRIEYQVIPTGIENVTISDTKAVYTLDGRKVNVEAGKKLNKGIYIIGGKKVYVK